jgi:predicted HTH transcriptional regulator
MPDPVDTVLTRLAILIEERRYEPLETDALEIKPVPGDGASWRERHKSVNAFLNTRGGILLLGFKEEGQGPDRRWVFTGWREQAEEKLKEFSRVFFNRTGTPLDLRESFPEMQLRPFMNGHFAVVYVDELPSDQKYVFYRGEAWRRLLTGDHKISDLEIESQEEYREEMLHARETQTISGSSLDDLDLDPLNDYIQQLNRPVKVETIKADLQAARSFLERKGFVRDGLVTTLGLLVCGKHPEDRLGFRCHVHGYVDVPQTVAQDKQDYIGNILPLMQSSLAYLLRNIQIGVSTERGGTEAPQYPEEVLRETVNNALAHRDYSINKQAILSIKPGHSISIRNPGGFRKHLLIDLPDDPVPLRRIIPEAKARNPKLADVLRVYRKWEGKGIGMATLVNLCLENKIDLPTYRFYSEEVCLCLNAGPLCGDSMQQYLASFDAYIETKLGCALTESQKLVLSYLIKSERANRSHFHTILLTPDNNHFEQLLALEQAELIHKHQRSTSIHPIYVVDRVLMQDGYRQELQALFGETLLAALEPVSRRCLDVLYRNERYSKSQAVTAKMAAFSLWYEEKGALQDIKAFDAFYRKVRYAFNKLEKGELILKPLPNARGFALNEDYLKNRLF